MKSIYEQLCDMNVSEKSYDKLIHGMMIQTSDKNEELQSYRFFTQDVFMKFFKHMEATNKTLPKESFQVFMRNAFEGATKSEKILIAYASMEKTLWHPYEFNDESLKETGMNKRLFIKIESWMKFPKDDLAIKCDDTYYGKRILLNASTTDQDRNIEKALTLAVGASDLIEWAKMKDTRKLAMKLDKKLKSPAALELEQSVDEIKANPAKKKQNSSFKI